MENGRNWSSSRGELVKLNLRQCECGRVWMPEQQGSKVGLSSGWYDDLSATREAVEGNPAFDPVIRISSSKRGRIVCPNCR